MVLYELEKIFAAWYCYKDGGGRRARLQAEITPVRAQKIRFERPSSDVFHLKRISVYGQ